MPPESLIYRSEEGHFHRVRASADRPPLLKPLQKTTPKTTPKATPKSTPKPSQKPTDNPYSFEPTHHDYLMSQTMMMQNNHLFFSVQTDPDIVKLITHLSLRGTRYLFLQQENETKFFDDLREHEMSKLSISDREESSIS
eukprot:gene13388-14718_t